MVNPNSQELILQAIKDRYNFEFERVKRLDDKTNNVMTIAGILVGLVAGTGSLSITISELTWIQFGAFLSFLASLAFLILAFWNSLKAYKLRNYIAVPDPPSLIVEGEKMDQGKLMEALYINYTIAVRENEETTKEKTKNVEKAIDLILISIILFTSFSFFTILIK